MTRTQYRRHQKRYGQMMKARRAQESDSNQTDDTTEEQTEDSKIDWKRKSHVQRQKKDEEDESDNGQQMIQFGSLPPVIPNYYILPNGLAQETTEEGEIDMNDDSQPSPMSLTDEIGQSSVCSLGDIDEEYEEVEETIDLQEEAARRKISTGRLLKQLHEEGNPAIGPLGHPSDRFEYLTVYGDIKVKRRVKKLPPVAQIVAAQSHSAIISPAEDKNRYDEPWVEIEVPIDIHAEAAKRRIAPRTLLRELYDDGNPAISPLGDNNHRYEYLVCYGTPMVKIWVPISEVDQYVQHTSDQPIIPTGWDDDVSTSTHVTIAEEDEGDLITETEEKQEHAPAAATWRSWEEATPPVCHIQDKKWLVKSNNRKGKRVMEQIQPKETEQSKMDDRPQLGHTAIFDRPLDAMTRHLRPLHITAEIDGIMVNRILIDSGAAVNTIPCRMLKRLGKTEADLTPTDVTLTGFSGVTTPSKGILPLNIKVGSVTRTTAFFVVDAATSYNVLLGRDWIHGSKCVPSSLHQCLFIWNDGGVVEHILADNHPFQADANSVDASFYDCTYGPLQFVQLDDEQKLVAQNSDLVRSCVAELLDPARPTSVVFAQKTGRSSAKKVPK